MHVLDWNLEKLHFRNSVLDAWVARSREPAVLEHEKESLGPTLPMDTALFIRLPPAPRQPPAPEMNRELWLIRGLGSFDSIRLAREVFNCPDDELFAVGVNSLEAIISMLSEGFVEEEFKLVLVSPVELLFDLTKRDASVTREQYALLDGLNKRFFGCSEKTVNMSAPGSFVIGSPM